jgi:bifunctional DNase/RNase
MASACIADNCCEAADVFTLIVEASGHLLERSFCRAHGNLLELVPGSMQGSYFNSNSVSGVFEECRLRAVIFENDAQAYTVVLKSTRSQTALVFPTGYSEAASIWGYAERIPHSTTATHELLTQIVHELGAEFQEGVLFNYRSDQRAYECVLKIARDGARSAIPCRISDLVALSLVTPLPISIDTSFLVDDPIKAA